MLQAQNFEQSILYYKVQLHTTCSIFDTITKNIMVNFIIVYVVSVIPEIVAIYTG